MFSWTKQIPLRFSALGLLLWAQACRLEWGAEGRVGATHETELHGPVMVYTSAYPPVVSALSALAAQALPGIEIKWFQAGSEKLAARLDAELLADNPGADLLMASDPMYYSRLKARGALRPYAALRALRLDRRFVDRDAAFVACRLSVMGLAHRRELTNPPRRFAELLSKRADLRITLPEPLGSGTMLATLIALERRMPLIDGLAMAHAQSSGGGTAVVDRLQRNEANVGIALFENVALAAHAGVSFLVQEDGPVVVPGGLAILGASKHARAAERVYDFLLSEAAQRVFVAHALHSPFDDLPPPEGAPSLEEMPAALFVWNEEPSFVEQAKQRWAKRFKEAR